MLHALTGDRHRAEDLAQEALPGPAGLGPRRGLRPPGAWVRRVALNAVVQRRPPAGAGGAAARAASAWRRRRRRSCRDADEELWRAVRGLPEQQRWAVALYYVEDRSVADVAAVLGCSEGTVKTHLSPGAGDARPPAPPARRGGRGMTKLDDERIDQRLRRAGERLRHEAPPPPRRPTPSRRSARGRAAAPRGTMGGSAVVAAVAASVVGLWCSSGRATRRSRSRPADQPSLLRATCPHTCTRRTSTVPAATASRSSARTGSPAQGCLAGDQRPVGAGAW